MAHVPRDCGGDLRPVRGLGSAVRNAWRQQPPSTGFRTSSSRRRGDPTAVPSRSFNADRWPPGVALAAAACVQRAWRSFAARTELHLRVLAALIVHHREAVVCGEAEYWRVFAELSCKSPAVTPQRESLPDPFGSTEESERTFSVCSVTDGPASSSGRRQSSNATIGDEDDDCLSATPSSLRHRHLPTIPHPPPSLPSSPALGALVRHSQSSKTLSTVSQRSEEPSGLPPPVPPSRPFWPRLPPLPSPNAPPPSPSLPIIRRRAISSMEPSSSSPHVPLLVPRPPPGFKPFTIADPDPPPRRALQGNPYKVLSSLRTMEEFSESGLTYSRSL
jgi:hypothetical protein